MSDKPKCEHRETRYVRDDYDRMVEVHWCVECSTWLTKSIPD